MRAAIFSFQIRFARLQLLALSLCAVLQRSPLVQLASRVESALRVPITRILQTAASVIGFGGAAHSLTGATTFQSNPASPADAKVGESFSMAFSLTGTPAPVASWEVLGTLPPGLTMTGLQGSTLNQNIGTISGTPTTTGTYDLTVQPYKGTNKSDITNGEQYPLRIVVASSTPPLDTTFVANPGPAISGSVSRAIDLQFSVQGMTAQSWKITGTLPPGLVLKGQNDAPLQGETLNAAAGSITGSPTGPGQFLLTLQAHEAINLGGRADPKTYQLSFDIADLSAYEKWKRDELGDIDATDDGDPDRDGLPNIVEYALLRDPNRGDSPAFLDTQLAGAAGEPKALAISLERSPLRDDIVIEVQASASLNGPWEPIAISDRGAAFAGEAQIQGDSGPADANRAVTVRDTVAADAGRFLRIAVREPTP